MRDDKTFRDFFAGGTKNLMQSPQLEEAAAHYSEICCFILSSASRWTYKVIDWLNDVITY